MFYFTASYLNDYFGVFVLFPDVISESVENDGAYLVFARKYRPQNFDSLIGQSHLIQMLGNAFDTGRIAHAYVLTGVRGVGKTTTARILAKGFNCTGIDNQNTSPTLKPCGICANCVSITNGKNIDVYEMDAASRTGINDIREIIDSLPYKPLTCRYKVFIIDEVHMLSTQAFNGLLKTLEEPPGHVKFIFATTEIHKIPATILSRCQRIDLKRVEISTLITHFQNICNNESITYDDAAIAQIARNADGSVRDGLSLLDQAVARGGGTVTVDAVSDMLGGSQTESCLNILQTIHDYNAAQALSQWNDLYKTGCDPHLFIKEFMRHIEWLIRFKTTPELCDDISLSETLRHQGKSLANGFSVPMLSRLWDITLKAIGDIDNAPDAYAVCEIMLVRCVYGLNMPDIMPLMMKNISGVTTDSEGMSVPVSSQEQTPDSNHTEKKTLKSVTPVHISEPSGQMDKTDNTLESAQYSWDNFENLLKFLSFHKALTLKKSLEMDYIISDYAAESFSITPVADKKGLMSCQKISSELGHLTKTPWSITLLKPSINTPDTQSYHQEKQAEKQNMIEKISDNIIIKEILSHFPDAKITDIKDI